MRKFVKKLLDRTECVLGTGHSFLFVTNFEKKKYKELFGEFVFKENIMKSRRSGYNYLINLLFKHFLRLVHLLF